MAQFAVIGMGRFGRAVARNLALIGESILAVDHRKERLDSVAAEVDSVAITDTTDEGAVAALQLHRMTAVVVAMGSRATEASLLTTAILKELKVPYIVARAFDERHSRLLLAVGANEVLNPEDDMGKRLAIRLAHPGVLAEIAFGDAVVAEVETPEQFVGRTLAELSFRSRHGISILAIRRDNSTQVNPDAEARLESGDIMVVLGRRDSIDALAERR